MLCTKMLLALTFTLSLGAGYVAAHDKAPETAPAAPPEFKLPPGWTLEDVQACVLAATPGKMHQLMAEGVGEWKGKNTMWMGPEAEPIQNESSAKLTALMDGRFFQLETFGDMPGMGPYRGLGIYGFDNVSQKFTCTWIDNHGTGMMTGTGALSEDGKTLTWTFNYNCPITKKPTVMREVETFTGPDSRTLEMWGSDPKSGKEYKMMRIELTRK